MKKIIYPLICVIAAAITLSFDSAICQNWQPLGSPSIGNASVTDLATGRASTDQKPTVYSVQGSTIYRSTDGGTVWNTTAPTPIAGTPKAVTCQQSAPTRVVTNYLDGSLNGYVVYSSDAGASWGLTNVYQDPHAIAFRLTSFPTDPLKMLMGMEAYNGFYSMKRSINGGITWTDVDSFYSGHFRTDVVTIAPHKTNVNHVFAGGKVPPERGTLSAMAVEIVPVDSNGVFFSTDAGLNWKKFTDSDVKNKNIVATVAYKKLNSTYNYVLAAREDRVVYRMSYTTTNPSVIASWIKMSSFPLGIDVTDLSVDGNNVIYAATSTGILKSTDHGLNWSSANATMINPSGLRRVAIDPQSNSNIFTGSLTNLYKSTDGGCTWRDAAPNINSLNTISAVGANGATMLAVPSGISAVARSSGISWTTLGLTTVNDFVGNMIGFKSSDGAVALAVGYRSTNNYASLLRNGNNGDNTCGNIWNEVRSGTTPGGKYNGFVTDPANSDRVYAFGLIQNGNTSTNENYNIGVSGGTIWSSNSLPNRIQTYISEIADFVADSTGHGANNYSLNLYAAIYSTLTGDQGIWKSVNGGTNWTKIWNQPTRTLGFNPKVASVIYAARADSLCLSINSGSIWSARNIWPGTGNVSRILMHPSYSTSSNYFWIIQGGIIYKTINGGMSWTEVPTTGLSSGTVFNDLRRDITNNTTIYTATNNGVWKIDPAPEIPSGLWGGSYRYCPCPVPPGCEDVITAAIPETPLPPCPWSYYAKLVWSANAEDGATYSIYRSTSQGGGYTQIASLPYTSTSYIDYSVGLPNPTTYYYKMTTTDVSGNVSDTSLIVSVGGPSSTTVPKHFVEESNSGPGCYQLFQNSPNPFNPFTIIKYELPIDNYVTIKVYNMLGQEVATLVDEFEMAGYKSIMFDGSNLSSGIYFVRLNAISPSPNSARSFIDVKKIILAK